MSPYVASLLALLVLTAACTTTGTGESVGRAAERTTASPAAREYPDAITRRMRRLAAAPRPVEGSAMPPRHLDVEEFPQSLVERTRIVSGGPPPDGIPAIDDPRFEVTSEVDWLADEEAVLVAGPVAGQPDSVVSNDDVRIYPIRIMMWHEIVNDELGGTPVSVTYCPLCNSAVAYDRRLGDRVLDFGTSGALYRSAMVMYDRQTESLWTHFDGRAVIGTLIGSELRRVPVATVSWQEARTAYPDAPVLSRETGHARPYGRNPYIGYDQADQPLEGFFRAEVDAREAPMTRVVGIVGEDSAVAIGTDHLATSGVVDVEVDGRPLTAWWVPGTASALQARDVAGGDDVGATGVFVARHDGRRLHFSHDGGHFVDAETQSTWNVLGHAIDGPLTGARLEAVPHVDTFWFAWSSYYRDTDLLPVG